MGVPSSWTDERDALLKQLLEAGATRRAVARHLGVNVKAVIRRINRLSLDQRAGSKATATHLDAYLSARRGFHVPRHLEAKYHELIRTGLPIAEICKRLGIENSSKRRTG